MPIKKPVSKKRAPAKLGAAKVAKPKKEACDYKISISTSDQTWDFETNDILEVIKSFNPPTFFKTETIIKVASAKKSIEKMLNVAQAKRMFSGRVAMELLAKDLKTLVD